jgi:hypothetical protein
MPTYRELMDAAKKAHQSGNSAHAKRLVGLAAVEQNKPSAESPIPAVASLQSEPVVNKEETPSVGQIAGGVASEVAIGTSSQMAGAALAPVTMGLSYPVLSFIGGVTGSIAAQKIEGRENISLGRSLFGGLLNLLPASQLAKGAGKLAPAIGKEIVRGATIGAGEASATAILDKDRLPTVEELATYGAAGGVSSPIFTLGVRGIVKLSQRGKELFDSLDGKNKDEALKKLNNIMTEGAPEEKAAAQEIVDSIGEQMGFVRSVPPKSAEESAAVIGAMPVKSASESAEILASAPLTESEEASRFVGSLQPKSAQESALAMGLLPAKSAKESADALKQELERKEQLASQFLQARTEQELKESLISNRLSGPEQVTFDPETPLENVKLSFLETRRGESVRERARLEKSLGRNLDEPLPTTEDVIRDYQNIPGVGGRAGARKMGLEGGFITPSAGFTLARAGVGGAIGSTQGDTPEERAQNAAIGAALGAASTPKIFNMVFKGGNNLWNTIKTKSSKEVDQMVKSGVIMPRDFGPSSEDSAAVSIAVPLQREAEKLQIKSGEAAANEIVNLEPSEIIKPIGPVAEKLKKFFYSITPSRAIGSDANEDIITYKNSVSAINEIGGRLRNKIEIVINRSVDPVESQKAVNAYLDGTADSLPTALKPLETELDLAREKILELQKQLLANIDNGIAFDPNKDGGTLLPDGRRIGSIIKDSMDRGNYLTREYRFFTDKKYFPSIAQKNEAIKELANSFYTESGEAGSYISRERASDMAKEYLEDLSNKKLSSIGSYDFYPSSIDGFLKNRKNIGTALRGYLGEIVDPGERVAGTLNRLAKSVYRDVADASIADNLKLFGVAFPTRVDPRMVPLVLRRRDKSGPQLYVPSYVQDSVNQLYLSGADEKAGNAFFRGIKDVYESGVSLTKATKILFNPPAYSVQLYGNSINLIGQGINPFGNSFARGMRLALAEFGPIERLTQNKEGRVALLNDLQEMTKYGIKGANITDSDIRSGLESGFVGKLLQKGLTPFSKTYTVFDTVGRYVAWKSNEKVLGEIFPSSSPESIKKFAASVTNDTYQNYQRLSNSARLASKIGIIPEFVSFTLEFARNQYHQGRVIREMISGTFGNRVKGLGQADIARMQTEGYKRLASLSIVYGGAFAAIKAFNQENGVDEKTENALRDISIPSYDKSRTLGMTLDKDKMTGKYFNPSYIAPHAIFLSAFKAGMDGSPVSSVANLLVEDFVGEGTMFARSLYSALSGFDSRTGKAISPAVGAWEQFKDRFDFFIKETFETGAQRESVKYQQAKRGEGDLSVEDVVARQFGLRSNVINVNSDAMFRFRELSNKSKLAVTAYTNARDYSKGKLGKEEIESQYVNSNRVKKDLLDVSIRHIESLRTLGFNDDKIIEIMKEGGMGGKDILAAFDQQFIPIPKVKRNTPSDYWSENLSMMPDKEQRERIVSLSKNKETLGLAKDLNAIYKSNAINKSRGISGMDSIVLSLGVDDGERAQYLHNKAINSPNYDAFLNGAIRKKLVTPEVMRQMTLLRK